MSIGCHCYKWQVQIGFVWFAPQFVLDFAINSFSSGGGVTGDQLAGWWTLKPSLDTNQTMYKRFLRYYKDASPGGAPATFASAAAFNGKCIAECP